MKILVTGSSGFIGSHTITELIKRGHTVAAIDNEKTKAPDEYIQARRKPWKNHVHFERDCDITDFQALHRVFMDFKPEAVINLAAKAGVRDSINEPLHYCDTNMTGVAVILQVMMKHGCHKMIQASTSSVYASCHYPFEEEDAIYEVYSPYAATKLGAEKLCESWCRVHEGFDITCLRYFTVYGDHGRPDMLIDRLIQSALTGSEVTIFGDGSHQRAFTHVLDVATANAIAVQEVGSSIKGFNVINIGNDEESDVEAVIYVVEETTGKSVNWKQGDEQVADMKVTNGDFSKAEGMLDGWRATIDIEDGIKRAVEAATSLRPTSQESS